MSRIYIDMDGTIFDFDGAKDEALIKNPDIKFPQSQYGFFENLKPFSLAITVVNWLDENFDVWIATAPSILNPLCYTEKRNSIAKHFGLSFLEKLIIIPDKSLLIGDYLIDDNVTGKGQENFNGELIHYGSKTYPNWRQILFYFDNEINKRHKV